MSAGLLPPTVTHLANIGNLMCLCSTCHRHFDAVIPGLVILPANLAFFIDWEERDYSLRCQAARDGDEVPMRTVPAETDYPGMFKAYPLDYTIRPTTVFREKQFIGSPLPLILKSGLGLLQPVLTNDGNENNERYPSPDQRALMTRLMDLYSRPAPKAKRDKDTAKKNGGEDEEEDEDEDGKEEKGEASRGPKRRRIHKSTHEAVQKPGERRSNPPRKSHPSRPSPYKVPVNAPWLLGPWMSTNDTLSALGIRQH
jgi:hypothetical protein